MEKSGKGKATTSKSPQDNGRGRMSTRSKSKQRSSGGGGGESSCSMGKGGSKRQKLNSDGSAPSNHVVGRNDMFVNLPANKIKFEEDESNVTATVKQVMEMGEVGGEAGSSSSARRDPETLFEVINIGDSSDDSSDVDVQVRTVNVKEEVDIGNGAIGERPEETTGGNNSLRREAGFGVPVVVGNNSSAAAIQSNDAELLSVRKENDGLKRKLKQRNVETRVLAEKIEQLELQLEQNATTSCGVNSSFQKRSQVASCTNCDEKDRLLQEKDEKIADLQRRLEEAVAGAERRETPVCGEATQIVKVEPEDTNDLDNEEDRSNHDSDSEGSAVEEPIGVVVERKVLLLFDEVLKVLIRQGSHFFGQTQMRGQGFLLTSCRLVSKSWKRSVDTFLEGRTPHVAADWKANNSSLLRFSPRYTLFEGVMRFDGELVDPQPECERISRFTEIFKQQQALDPSLNPIPTRHLEITAYATARSNKKWAEFSESVLDYLEAFGREIWYISLVARTGKISKANDTILMLAAISSWLELTPNLKSLSFDVTSDPRFDRKQLERDLELNQGLFKFPHLKNMIALESKNENLLLSYLLKENRHVQKFGLTWTTLITHKIMEMDLQDLSELSLEISRQEDWQRLENLWKGQLGKKVYFAPWKLLKLCVSFYKGFNTICSLESLLTALPVFQETLQYLSLDLSSGGVYGKLGENALALPCLKYLHVKYRQRDAVVRWENFLNDLNQLEKLELEVFEVNYESRVSSVEKEAFWKYIDAVHEASYWSRFAQLTNVNVTVTAQCQWSRPEMRFQNLRKRPGMQPLKFDVVRKVFSNKTETVPVDMYLGQGSQPNTSLRSCKRALWHRQHFL